VNNTLEDIGTQLLVILPRLRRFCIGLAGSVADGDDLCQATVERALANQRRFKPGSRLDSWLFKIARNLFLNKIRADTVRRGHLHMVQQTEQIVQDGEAAGQAKIELGRVFAEVCRLPEEQRSVLLLVAVEGMSYKDTAAITGLPIGTVTSRIARARQSLRVMVGESQPTQANVVRRK
jgi:RNA polymerase sigma-70 factor, ECF subfamily